MACHDAKYLLYVLYLSAKFYYAQSIPDDFATAVKTFITATMQCPQYSYPGVALSVVIDGKTILSEGYGLRDIASQMPFTNETLIGIGSCTKSFTAVLLAMLRDEGKLDWQDRVRRFVPELTLLHEYTSERVTLTDLLVHRTGLPRHDVALFAQYNRLTRLELSRRMHHLSANLEFREGFQYTNLMYAVCGAVMERITGTEWEQLVHQRIFAALHMHSSTTNVTQAMLTPHYAVPYALWQGAPVAYARDVNKIVSSSTEGHALAAPGGGIISSARDMALWLQMLTSRDSTVLSRRSLTELWTPVQSIQADMTQSRPTARTALLTTGYGLGWMSMLYNNVWITFHGGTVVGNLAMVLVVPELNLGVSLMTNIDSDPAGLRAIALYIVDLALGDVPLTTAATVCQWPCNWVNCTQRNTAAPVHNTSTSAVDQSSTCAGDGRNAPLMGVYEHLVYGALSIAASHTHGLMLNYSLFTGQCVQWNSDHSFTIALSGPVLMQPMQFEVTVMYDSELQITGISIPFEATVSNIAFMKRVDEAFQSATLPAWGIALIVIAGVVLVGILVLVYLKVFRNKVVPNDVYHLVSEN